MVFILIDVVKDVTVFFYIPFRVPERGDFLPCGVLLADKITCIICKAAHTTCSDLLALFYACCVIGVIYPRTGVKGHTGR